MRRAGPQAFRNDLPSGARLLRHPATRLLRSLGGPARIADLPYP